MFQKFSNIFQERTNRIIDGPQRRLQECGDDRDHIVRNRPTKLSQFDGLRSIQSCE
jgi:hypothetical protein